MKTNLTLLLFIISLTAYAQDKAAKPDPKAQVFTSNQEVTINGRTIGLNAEAGTLELRNDNDEPIALSGYTYYERKGLQDERTRPIVFAFNGGPLSASFWLHMGILGPKRIDIDDPGFTKGPPYRVVNNEFSLLDVADLVMIDPVGVGLSRPIGESKWTDFWGVDEDIRAITLFIEQFLIKKGRVNSPKYLLGESYGTFRNAGLVASLQDRGIAMNGVVMVSAVFELQHLLFPPGDDIAYMIHFPTYAATAWYHDQIPGKEPDLNKFLDEVRRFTRDEYAPALLKGDQLSTTDKNNIAQKLADFTGTDQDYWLRANLRVTNGEFFAEALREDGKIVGRLDSRFTGINQDPLSQMGSHDPQSSAISPPYIAAFKDYLYNDLKVDRSLSYVTTAGMREGFRWNWNHSGNMLWGGQAAISTAPDMARALSQNPHLKILILNGIYDIATVFHGVEYTIDHMGLTPEIKDNIIMKYYEAGHMMYTHGPSMKQFREDVVGFIRETSEN